MNINFGFMLSIADSPRAHRFPTGELDLLDHPYTNTIKAFLGLSSRGPTPAISFTASMAWRYQGSLMFTLNLILFAHTLAFASAIFDLWNCV